MRMSFCSALQPGSESQHTQAREECHQDVEHGATGREREVVLVGEHVAVPVAAYEQSEPLESTWQASTAAEQPLRRLVQLRRTAPGRTGS